MKKKSNAIVKKISCEESARRVFDYIDDHLRATKRDEVEQHLETCRHCFKRYEFEKLLKARLHTATTDRVYASLRKKVEEVLKSF